MKISLEIVDNKLTGYTVTRDDEPFRFINLVIAKIGEMLDDFNSEYEDSFHEALEEIHDETGGSDWTDNQAAESLEYSVPMDEWPEQFDVPYSGTLN